MSTAASTSNEQLPKLGFLEEDDEFEEFPIEGNNFSDDFSILKEFGQIGMLLVN